MSTTTAAVFSRGSSVGLSAYLTMQHSNGLGRCVVASTSDPMATVHACPSSGRPSHLVHLVLPRGAGMAADAEIQLLSAESPEILSLVSSYFSTSGWVTHTHTHAHTRARTHTHTHMRT